MAVTEASVPSVLVADEAVPSRRRTWLRKLQLGFPIGLLALVFFACFILPMVAPVPKPTGGDILESLQPSFSPGHFLGTDPNGNDIFSRILYGGRSSLFIALSVNLLGLIVGGSLGAIAAQAGGFVDGLIMRLFDVL